MLKIKYTAFAFATLLTWQSNVFGQTENTFTHTIQKGETVYSIAKTYSTSVDKILELNPNAQSGIKVGNTLIIPQKGNGIEIKEKYHTIEKGETLYQLTQKYGVSANEICSINPGLTAENFKIGQVIRIPITKAVSANNINNQPVIKSEPLKPDCMDMHKVKRRETLYGIAKEYGISEEELRKANPETNEPGYKLKKGSFLCIPYPQKTNINTTQPVKEPSNSELIVKNNIPVPSKLIKMGVLLPLKSKHAESDKMIEFYRGLLMAVDSIKKNGVSIEIYSYDSGKTPAEIQNVLDSRPLSGMDIIIGPLYSEQITPLSKYCQKNKIRMVVPFSSLGDEVYVNPLYFAVNSPKSFHNSEAAELTANIFGQSNILIVESEENDKNANSFINTLTKRLGKSSLPHINIMGDEYSWLNKMIKNKENILLPNSSSLKFLNKFFPKLKEFTDKNPEYSIKIIGYPEWQTYTNNQLENFYKYNTYAFSSFYRDPMSEKNKNFEKKYISNFSETTIMSFPKFGLLGFDIGYFFIKGISEYGESFENNINKIKGIKPFQNDFEFKRVSNWSGFINKEMKFIHYSPDHRIELIQLNR